MRRLFVVLLLISPLLTAAVPFVLLAVPNWEPNDARPGSLAHLLVIPAAAKRFPLWDACDDPSFSYRGKDGPAPEMYSLQYRTRLTPVDIALRIDDYTRLQACKYHGAPEVAANGVQMGLDIICGTTGTQVQFVFPRAPINADACIPLQITFIESRP